MKPVEALLSLDGADRLISVHESLRNIKFFNRSAMNSLPEEAPLVAYITANFRKELIGTLPNTESVSECARSARRCGSGNETLPRLIAHLMPTVPGDDPGRLLRCFVKDLIGKTETAWGKGVL